MCKTCRCQCGNCEYFGELPVCCHKYAAMKERLKSIYGDFKCITQHPGFHSNCLDIHVLEASFYKFCQNDGEPGDDEPLHETLRYIAYRRMVRWIFKKLGQKNRKRLPACVVLAIRNRFPADNGEYTGFKYA